LKANETMNIKNVLGSGLGLALTVVAFEASASTSAGMTKAVGVAQDFQTGLYMLAGAAGGIYLIYLGLMAFMEKKSWSDFGMGVVHVAVLGAAVSIAGWAWTAFAS
jgi:hypothetical protein